MVSIAFLVQDIPFFYGNFRSGLQIGVLQDVACQDCSEHLSKCTVDIYGLHPWHLRKSIFSVYANIFGTPAFLVMISLHFLLTIFWPAQDRQLHHV